MGEIRVVPDDVSASGQQIVALAPGAGALAGVAASASAGVSEPPATADALADFASEWSAGAERLQEELTSLGGAAEAAAFFYGQADRQSMGGGR